MAQFQVRLPAEWMAALDMSARAQGMTRSGLVRWLVGRHLKGPEETKKPLPDWVGGFFASIGLAYGFTGQSIWRGKPSCSGTSLRA